MKQSSMIFRYLSRTYIFNLIVMIVGLWAVIYLFDTVELLRRAGKKDDIPLGLVLRMGMLKLPEVGLMTLPFAVLFSAIFTFWKFNRQHELVILRSAGFSLWQVLTPVILTGFAAGMLSIMVINPIGAMLVSRYEALENTHLSNRQNYAALFEEGLWLRQNYEDGYSILHAATIQMPAWQLQDVMVVFFRDNNEFLRRLNARGATLEQGNWVFKDATVYKTGQKAEDLPLVSLPTDLTIEEIEESFSSPETLSFWKIPAFIRTLEATGFSSVRLRVHFQSLLSKPLLYVAMILLAAAVSIRPPRFTKTLRMVVSGIVIGFVTFFMSNFLQALGTSHQIPVLLAAWSPAFTLCLMGIASLLYLEDT